MKIFIPICLWIIWSCASTFAQAQDYEQGSGIAGCQAGSGVCNGWQWQQSNQQGPSGQQNQAPPSSSHWQSRWGAIVTDAPQGIVSSSKDQPNSRKAEQVALSDCKTRGGINCKLQVSYSNGCAALAYSGHTFAVESGPSLNEASRKAIQTCNRAASDCEVYLSTCSAPALVR